jgi:hypothetical protein
VAPIILTAQQKLDAFAKAGADIKFLFGKEDIAEEVQAVFFHVGVTSISRFATFCQGP